MDRRIGRRLNPHKSCRYRRLRYNYNRNVCGKRPSRRLKLMATRPARKLDTPEQSVREANHRFYRALASLSLEEMDAIWLHEDWVECVHPGWDMLLGWEEVRASWVRIFSSTQRMQMEIHSVWVRVEGDVAWVACTEQITSTFERGFDQALVQATNIFVRRAVPPDAEGRGGRTQWLLVAHHASPLPAGQPPQVQ